MLADAVAVRTLVERVVRELSLTPAAEPVWKVFGGAGGVTGLVLLTESHLTVHTFPEHGHVAINLYCCRPRAEWDWRQALEEAFGATRVRVRKVSRSAFQEEWDS